MKKIIFLFILVLIIKPGFSQVENSDLEELLIQVDSISSISNRTADSLARMGYKIAKEENNAKYQVEFLVKQAFLKGAKLENRSSISLLFEALIVCQENNFVIPEIEVMTDIAMRHCYIRDFDNAYLWIQKTFEKLYQVNDSNTIAEIFHIAGEIYSWTSAALDEEEKIIRKDSACFFFEKSLNYRKDTTSDSYAWSLAGMASAINLKKADSKEDSVVMKRLELYKHAIKILDENNTNRRALASTLIRLASTYIYIDPMQCIDLSIKARHIAQEIENSFQIQQSHRNCFFAYQNIGDYKNAFFHLKTYDSLVIQTLKTENISAIADLREKYETEQKEATIKQQRQELILNKASLKYQRRILIVSILASLILVIASIIFYKLYKKNKSISVKNVLLVKEQNHRVKNNLQIISALLSLQANRVENSGAKRAIEDSKLRVEAIGMIQKKLYGENTVEVNVNEFVEELVDSIISLYDFEKTQIKKKLLVDAVWMRVEKTVPLGLILNELLTNSCKYAFDNNPTPELNISLCEENNQIRFSYHDNGGGFNPEEVDKQKSFGIKLIDLQSYQLGAEHAWEKNGGMEFRMVFES